MLQALQLNGVMDAVPTENSNRPVKSDGIYTAIQPVDTVQDGNLKAVTSNAVFDALPNMSIPSYWQDANNKDPLAIVESLVTTNAYSRFISFRMGNATSNNTPYGSNVDTDFFYQAYIIESKDYCIMTAYDVRSNRCYRISKVSGTWGAWELLGTETIYTGTFNDIISSGGYNFSSLQKSGRQVDFVCRFVKESSTTFSQRTIIGTVP